MITTFGFFWAAATGSDEPEKAITGPASTTRARPILARVRLMFRVSVRSGKFQARRGRPAQFPQPMTVPREPRGIRDVVQLVRVLLQVVKLLLTVRIIDVGVPGAVDLAPGRHRPPGDVLGQELGPPGRLRISEEGEQAPPVGAVVGDPSQVRDRGRDVDVQ